jgi:hypothetical protein
MNWQLISGNPFFTVALPLLIGMYLTSRSQNKRVDDLKDAMNKRFDGIDRRLEKIEAKLDNHTERIARVEERSEGQRYIRVVDK